MSSAVKERWFKGSVNEVSCLETEVGVAYDIMKQTVKGSREEGGKRVEQN